MPKTLSVFLALSSVCVAALAQDPLPEPGPARTQRGFPLAAEATPKPRGVLETLFGSRRGKRPLFAPTPAPQANPLPPAPAPTPRPVVTKTKKSTPAPVAKKRKPKAKAPVDEPAPTVAQNAPPEPANPAVEMPVGETPAVEKPVVEKPAPATPAPTKKTRKGKPATTAATANAAVPPDMDPEAREKMLFDAAKAQASEDPEVVELKAKADGAVTDDEARSAQRAYNKALYAKMRELDGSISGRIKEIEAAVLKRLDSKLP